MGRGGDQIELRRFGCVLRGEGDVDRTHRHIGAVAEVEVQHHAVDGDRACAADIDDAQLASLQEGRAGQRRRHGVGGQAQRGFGRGRAAHDHPLVVRIVQADLARHEQALDQVAVSQLLICRAVHHVGMGGLIDLVVHGVVVHAGLPEGLAGRATGTDLPSVLRWTR
ncbi:hypothetical protein D3C80_1369530 [compost metagenome]